MSTYRIVNTKPSVFVVDKKVWWGWKRAAGFYTGFSEYECECWINYQIRVEKENQVEQIKLSKWKPKPPRIYP